MSNNSHKEDGRPAMLWYWKDWFADIEVSSCSMASQGLWINMLGIMSMSDIKGTLRMSGMQMRCKELANFTRLNEKECGRLLSELETKKVFDRLSDGTIINRRMYRENEISRERSLAAFKRWGTGPCKTDANGDANTVQDVVCKPDARLEDSVDANLANANAYANAYAITEEIIDYYNTATGQKIKHGSKNVTSLISGRLKDGFTLDDFKKVIDKKHAQWKDDPKMSSFIRPSTLFAPSHFEDYLNERSTSKKEETPEEYKRRQDEATFGKGFTR